MPSLSIFLRTCATAASRPVASTNSWRSVMSAILRPRIGRVGDGVEVTRREALEAERVEQARMLTDEHLRHLAADADHLVAVVRVEDAVHVRLDVIEDREVVDCERADAAGARVLVLGAAALEAAHRVRERGAPHVGE